MAVASEFFGIANIPVSFRHKFARFHCVSDLDNLTKRIRAVQRFAYNCGCKYNVSGCQLDDTTIPNKPFEMIKL